MAYTGRIIRGIGNEPSADEPHFDVDGNSDSEAHDNARKGLTSRRRLFKANPPRGEREPVGVAVYKDGERVDTEKLDENYKEPADADRT